MTKLPYPDTASRPFGAGSVSVSLYTHGLPAREAAAFLVKQAQVAEAAGFDGVTVCEQHAGIAEYLPNPLLATAWILGATRRIWAGPCPLLLSLRSPLLVAEDMADCFLVPQIFNAQRYKCNLAPYPTVLRVFDRCMTQEAFKKAQPLQQPDRE